MPDHGEENYKGSGRLKDKKAIITGGDGGIGRAVAIAYAREGADVLISYLEEHEDAEETKRLVEAAGRKAVLVPGDIQNSAHCRKRSRVFATWSPGGKAWECVCCARLANSLARDPHPFPTRTRFFVEQEPVPERHVFLPSRWLRQRKQGDAP